MTTFQHRAPRIDYTTAQVDGRPASSEQIASAQRIVDVALEQRALGLKPVLQDMGFTLMVIGWARSTTQAKAIGRDVLAEQVGAEARKITVTVAAGTDLDGLPAYKIG